MLAFYTFFFLKALKATGLLCYLAGHLILQLLFKLMIGVKVHVLEGQLGYLGRKFLPYHFLLQELRRSVAGVLQNLAFSRMWGMGTPAASSVASLAQSLIGRGGLPSPLPAALATSHPMDLSPGLLQLWGGCRGHRGGVAWPAAPDAWAGGCPSLPAAHSMPLLPLRDISAHHHLTFPVSLGIWTLLKLQPLS